MLWGVGRTGAGRGGACRYRTILRLTSVRHCTEVCVHSLAYNCRKGLCVQLFACNGTVQIFCTTWSYPCARVHPCVFPDVCVGVPHTVLTSEYAALASSIAVLSPYRAQVTALRDAFRAYMPRTQTLAGSQVRQAHTKAKYLHTCIACPACPKDR